MATVKVDLAKQIKRIKPLHAGGQPPIGGKDMTEYFHYMTEAGIPYSRLHDVGGAFGGNRFVDIPNVFPNFDADENDPANYDFTFTDHLLKALFEAGVEPYYRLGITIENQAYIKPYRTFPPKDYEKWARICEHVIRHYTEGWANGYTYKITYWEIWNEPEVSKEQMWCGTDEEYYRLYEVASKYLKSKFPHLKIGGYASCGFYAMVPGDHPTNEHEYRLMEFFHGFFDYIRAHDCPIDFFSWHSYARAPRTLKMDAWLHGELERRGYGHLETHLNEWDPCAKEFGTAHHAAQVATTLIGLQHGNTDIACIYDMRTNNAPYCPLFDIRTHKPIHAYYCMVAFNTLYQLGRQVENVCDTEGLYALCASNGERHAMMMANLTYAEQQLCIEGADLSDARWYVLDQERLLSWSPAVKTLAPNDVVLVEW